MLKVGDRVKVIGPPGKKNSDLGRVGTIREIRTTDGIFRTVGGGATTAVKYFPQVARVLFDGTPLPRSGVEVCANVIVTDLALA